MDILDRPLAAIKGAKIWNEVRRSVARVFEEFVSNMLIGGLLTSRRNGWNESALVAQVQFGPAFELEEVRH
jgi:hypothetical protein